jgi:hypothetical protein
VQVVAPHRYGAHGVVTAGKHAPAPLQPGDAFEVPPVHEPVQSPCGSVLFDAGPQVPSAPPPFFAPVHATHGPVHAVSQHTPSTQ